MWELRIPQEQTDHSALLSLQRVDPADSSTMKCSKPMNRKLQQPIPVFNETDRHTVVNTSVTHSTHSVWADTR